MTSRGLVLLCTFLPACDESLPPRVDPRAIDPADFMEISVTPEPGVVFYRLNEMLPQTIAGAVWIEVTNLHDEVMSGPEEISIEVRYHGLNFPTDTARIDGDHDNLLNPFNLQGGMFMLHNGILTLHPDSTARFLITWDHTDERFWQYAHSVYSGRTCPNPPCAQHILSSTIDLEVAATIKLFSNQQILLYTTPVAFSIFYFFEVSSRASVTLLGDRISAGLDANGNVNITWTTTYARVHQFEVQRSSRREGEFMTVPNGAIDPLGEEIDTTAYAFVHEETEPGSWWYRLGITEYFDPAGVFLVDSTDAVLVTVP